jgi:hypothetical protein
VENVSSALLILAVGLPLGFAALLIAGCIVSGIAAPVIALYEDFFGYNRHGGANV